MLVTYERNRGLGQRLDEVYREAGLLSPTGGVNLAAPSDIPGKIPQEPSHPLGF
jgi:hypothetical protein